MDTDWDAPAAGSGGDRVDPTDSGAVLGLFRSVSDSVRDMVSDNEDWAASGVRDGQYAVDVRADAACVERLHGAGLHVLSEESGLTGPDDSSLSEPPSVVVVTDPLDGSTNATLELPWCATSICLVVDGAAEVAHVANLRTGERFEAVRGGGATLDGRPIRVSAPVDLADAVIAINGRPADGFRPRQFRAMGATALDVASVAAGRFDGYRDFDDDRIGVWDYLAAALVVEEAGGVVADAAGRDLVTLDHAARRRPVVASSPALLEQLLAAG